MSEYQYYEFQAIDRPLTEGEMREVRACSGRATITPTRFVNVYNWGSFKGDAAAWMEKYFDAFLYLANWGTHELAFRLPRGALDLEIAKRYLHGKSAVARAKGEFVILELRSDEEEGGRWVDDEEGSEWLSSLSPLRADIAGGDYRTLYLAWLLCAQREELRDDATEPLVPAGLGRLTAPLKALMDFLRIDGDLLAVAAENSPEEDDGPQRDEIERWIAALPDAEKTAMLVRLATGEESHVRAEMLRGLRQARRPTRDPAMTPRTVAELLAAAERHATERRREEAERAAREKARRKQQEAAARARYLDELAKTEVEAWRRVDALVATKRPADYDAAVKLLKDLRDLAVRDGRRAEVERRILALREQHAKKPSFLDRLGKAGLLGSAR